ncbi:hypothetical protein BDQ17DRAFT_1233150 [Cyathus striatus]|nr:hypothetical protein BDQ17DRAFT_1233150 [Cyathus striatus]
MNTNNPDIIKMGEGMTMEFLRSQPYLTRISISGAECLIVPRHWHERHDEYFHIFRGRLWVTIGNTHRWCGPEDGEVKIPKGMVHSLESMLGEEVVFEERTDPMDDEKEMFFRNLLVNGKISSNLLEVMHIFYYGDTRPALPGGFASLEKGLVTVIGGYIAPLIGVKRKINPSSASS